MTCEAELIGRRAEEMAAEICESIGFSVFPAPRNFFAYDLIVNGRRLQVKRRTTRPSERYRVEMKTSMRGAGYSYLAKDLDAFALLLNGEWFVFPVDAVSRIDGTIPNRILISSIAQYRDLWSVLGGEEIKCERQLGFDF